MTTGSPIELKGRIMSFTVLHVYGTDIQAIRQALSEKVSQAPGFFHQTPVVIQPHQDDWPPTFLAQLLEVLAQLSFVPIGIQTEQPTIQEQAGFLGLAVFPKEAGRAQPVERETEHAEAAQPPVTRPAMVVTRTVRAGQQIYAPQRDLVVLGTVNPGAEIYADGHIHVYGRLRGRAFAGARGDTSARLFVQQLMAEMVCIAGLYQLSDDIPDIARQGPCMITLKNDMLHYTPLDQFR